jgi:hypothetical protein
VTLCPEPIAERGEEGGKNVDSQRGSHSARNWATAMGRIQGLIPARAIETVRSGRNQAVEIIEQRDDRLLVVVGPCSILPCPRKERGEEGEKKC